MDPNSPEYFVFERAVTDREQLIDRLVLGSQTKSLTFLNEPSPLKEYARTTRKHPANKPQLKQWLACPKKQSTYK